MLGTDGKPVMDGRCVAPGQTAICPKGQELTTNANFDQWYRDAANVNVHIPGALLLPQAGERVLRVRLGQVGFYPIDSKGWMAAPGARTTRWPIRSSTTA